MFLKEITVTLGVVYTNELNDAYRCTGYLQEAQSHANSVKTNVFYETSPHTPYQIRRQRVQFTWPVDVPFGGFVDTVAHLGVMLQAKILSCFNIYCQ